MTRRLRFTLLGTGSSGGVPRIGNDWGACDPNEPKNRRSRCSAMVEVFREGETEPTRVLIDTAPDLREQLLRAEIGRVDAIIFSHEHADQVGGLDDVRVLAIRQRAQVPVYMDARTAGDLTTRFAYCFKGAHGYPPMLALQDFIVPGRPASIEGPGGPVEFLPLDQVHGVIRSLGFRIGKLAYCN
ncbi:MAG: MBL fold metallo-hydrolase, partial [Pseudomonadota bacterium]